MRGYTGEVCSEGRSKSVSVASSPVRLRGVCGEGDGACTRRGVFPCIAARSLHVSLVSGMEGLTGDGGPSRP